MKRLRFSILTLLLAIAVVGAVVNCLMPPRVSFGEPQFTTLPAQGTFWGDMPARLVVRIPVVNDGIFPIWYQQVMPGGYAVGHRTEPAEETMSDPEFKIVWQKLRGGDRIQLRDYGLNRYDPIGIRVMDWTGRQFTIVCDEVEVEPVWLQRESLPNEVPDSDRPH